jgi:hypothetical protein
MTTKIQAIVTAWIAGITSFIAWLVALPPESQDSVIKPLIELTPLHWRPTIGLISRGVATASTIYAVYKAAHSGPQSPPKNPPNE